MRQLNQPFDGLEQLDTRFWCCMRGQIPNPGWTLLYRSIGDPMQEQVAGPFVDWMRELVGAVKATGDFDWLIETLYGEGSCETDQSA